MTNPIDEYRTRLRQALAQLGEMQLELDRVTREPIAIIGASCRFPGGAQTPEAFFQFIEQGRDAVSEVPPERWRIEPLVDGNDSARGARFGAFVKDVDLFDPDFFGISPREAARLDPQQRFLLEVSWEAMERAGVAIPERLNGSLTGVFVGIMTDDYTKLSSSLRLDQQDFYDLTGNSHTFPAGRISYTFGFTGPSFVVETACSSSLVAMHHACNALRSGECDMALAGGVGLMLSSTTPASFARFGLLAPDGRCKVFDARANGYVRGEGCGIVVLKRLSDAQRDGDSIMALIRGSAVNHNGRSMGFTVPNVPAQEVLVRTALHRADVEPSEIGFIETHGTGTSLGDPIEIDALAAVFGYDRADGTRCALGAVKTNIGHLEAAAGVAGLLKAVMVLRTGIVPKNLQFRSQNPRISIEGTPFVLPLENMVWPGPTPRRAGVSGFGLSGTNAHVVLEQAPAEGMAPAKESGLYLLPLSAKSPAALAALAGSYAEWLSQSGDISVPDMVYTASVRRAHHEYRLSATFSSKTELVDLLSGASRGASQSRVSLGEASKKGKAKVLFVFSGQGSQWAQMGQTLLAEAPVFRAKLEEIAQGLQGVATFSLLEELARPEESSRLGETEIAQPAIFAIQVALAELFKFWGIVPDAVIGHSVGEVAAAHLSGAISLAEAIRLVVCRGRVMQKATGNGKMAWVLLPRIEAERAIQSGGSALSIAAVNDPSSVVISGDRAAVDAFVGEQSARSVVVRLLRVNYAFHSPQMEPLAREFMNVIGRIDAHAASIAVYSTVDGRRIDGERFDAGYWGRNIRRTVEFASAVEAALDDGYQVIVEIGPHPVLLGNIKQCMAQRNISGHVIPTLQRRGNELSAVLEAVGALYVNGANVDWKNHFPEAGRVVALPAYCWQRERYWIEGLSSAQSGPSIGVADLVLSTRGAAAAVRPVRGESRVPNLCELSFEEAFAYVLDLVSSSAKQILQMRGDVDRYQPFTAMGMDSILAVQFSASLGNVLGLGLPPSLVYECGTANGLAERVMKLLRAPAGGASVGRMVALEEGGTRPPFFCVHPIHGLSLPFVDVARLLGKDQPFYVFEVDGGDPRMPLIDRIDEMARVYVRALRDKQRSGPYHIGGYSFGGIVAFEMAKQLLAMGESIASLVMFDCACIENADDPKYRIMELAQFMGIPLDEHVKTAGSVHALMDALATSIVEQMGLRDEAGTKAAFFRVVRAHMTALSSYRLEASAVRLTLFRAAEPLNALAGRMVSSLDESYGWNGYATHGVSTHIVPGNHFTLLAMPQVQVIASYLQNMLATGAFGN